MKKSVLTLFIAISILLVQAQDVEIQFGNITPSGASFDVEVLIKSTVSLSASQITIEGGIVRAASGGIASKAGWFLQTDSSAGTITSGSMSIQTLAPCDTILYHVLLGTNSSPENICITMLKFGSAGGTVTAENGNDSCITITGLTPEKINKPKFDVFPNPSTQGVFVIDQGMNINSIEVYDVLGNVVVRETNIVGDKVQVDLQDQQRGIYLLRINGEKESSVKRIIYN